MKYRIAGAAAAILVAALVSKAHACDCTLPINYGNSACAAGITAALKGNNGSTNSNTNGQGQSQGQGQTATGGASTSGAGASVGNTSAAGGQATGGNVGNTTSTSSGGNSTATGGKGGKASASSNNTNAGGSVSGLSATSGPSSANSSSTSAGGTSALDASQTNSGNTNIAAARIPVNTAIAGFQMTTAPCRYAEGLGIQTMPAGGAVGFTFKDHDCMKLGLAQEFYAHQQWEAGDRIMCAIHEVGDVLGKECLMILTAGHQVRVVVAAQAPTEAEPTYTRAQVDAIVKKVVSK